MSGRRTIALEVKLDQRPADSETTCMWAGPYVLVIATVLPERGLTAEVHSTFLGHAAVATRATHLILGPVGFAPLTTTAEHKHSDLDPTINARGCVYEHARLVLEILQGLGYEARIEVPDDAFGELERIES